ncbi:DUF5379 domain-containing protein [Methanobacterium alcaliphilum]|uniref:DUF5379 domain-containing protein n=1 Tax=Methanobacterium alcaliphilum TaxID=392018 RepID=UPI00200B73A1|nr:DUF5379 domain-containing protein [Methanobacterium alcaliphilum]MCK9151298.1 DUF5379 domain-containing protein [Methanobacterium alcaliphilum]
MEVDAKLASIHAVSGALAAYISFTMSNGSIPALGQNQALGTFAGLIILIIVGKLSETLFGKEEVGGFKGWLWSGIIPFAFIWFMVWAMLITMTGNY